MTLPELSVKNPVLVNMVLSIVFIFGVYAMIIIPKEEMPAVDFGTTVVVVNYPGVSPEEIEELIVNKIEAQLANLDGVDYLASRSEEGRATIRVVYETSYDIDKAYTELIQELDKVRDLPEDAFDPIILRINMREVNPIAQLVLSGDFSPNAIREISENLEDGIMSIPSVSRVDTFGARDREIWIEANHAKINHLGLSLNDISNAIRGRNLNFPGGTIDFSNTEYIVRTAGRFNDLEDIAQLILISDPYSGQVRINDVATVRDTLEDVSTISKLDGNESVNMYVYKKGEGNIITVMEQIRGYIEDYQSNIPGLEIRVRNDGSVDVRDSLTTLGNSALFGISLVFLSLFLFLGFKNAVFAAFGIPFSFLLTFILMYFFDITMNNLSLFALVLVLGMIVDNAIVVIENVYRYKEEGYCKKTAAVRGANEVMLPVFASAATTAAAFIPLLLMEGIMGRFMSLFPIVVTAALVASLFESLFVLPAQLSEYTSSKVKKKTESNFHRIVVKYYTKSLIFILKHRIKSVLAVIILLILSVIALFAGLVGFDFFPQAPATTLALKIQTPVGSSLDETNKIVSSIENYILNIPESSDIKSLVTNVGSMTVDNRMERRTHFAQIAIDLVNYRDMQYTHNEIRAAIRKHLDNLPGLYLYSFDFFRSGPPTGRDVEMRIKGDDLDRMSYISGVIQQELNAVPGVFDVSDSFEEGKDEIVILPRHNLLAVNGLTVAQIAFYVRTALSGSKVSEFRDGGLKQYDIVLKMSPDYINDLESLKSLKIRNRFGELIALGDLASFELRKGISSIEHRDRRRVITITANTGFYEENGRMRRRSPNEVTEILKGNRIRGIEGRLGNFEARFPGYQLEFGGVQEQQRESYNSLALAFLVAIILVYGILGTQFRSYVQPLIVMTTVPFAFIGVVFGLVVTRLPFSLNTFISVVALAGVVVNNSLILVDFINKERDRGIDRWNSIINAGTVRLRPIMLTTITTIVGLMPMIFSTARSSVTWKPMAVSIVFGLAFSTLLTLYLIPTIYSLVDSFFGKLHMTRFTTHESFKESIDCEEDPL